MDSGTVICSNCKKRVPKDEVICPECGLGLVPLDENETDLFADIENTEDDSFFADIKDDDEDFDDLFADLDEEQEDEESDDEIAEMLGLESSSTEQEMAIPQFDDSQEMAVPQFDDGQEMTIPQFDDSTFTPAKVETTQMQEEQEYTKIFRVNTKQWLLLLSKLWIYLIFIFIIISIATIEVKDPNITLDTLNLSQLYVGPDLFIFGWIIFFAMGWIVSYQLRKEWIQPDLLAASVFLLGFFILASLISVIIPLLNVGTILTIYISMISLGSASAFLSGGFFTFYLGYKMYFRRIFEMTPLSKSTNHIIENN